MRYLGKDRVCPVDWAATILTVLLILVPSTFILVYPTFKLCGPIGGWFVAAFYLVSLLNLLRIHHICRNTEPGIVPNIRSKRVDYNKQYFIRYRSVDAVI